MSNLTHVSNARPFPTQRLGVAPGSCGPPFSHSNSSSLPDPHVDEIHGGKLKFAASWATAEGWGWGNQPQINILFILPLKPTSQEPACSFPFSIYTFQKTMISY